MLSEDTVNTSVPSVYTKINNPDVPDDTCEDPLDGKNDRHYGFSREKPHVINTTTNVVILPSINKWNCFSIHDRRTVEVIESHDNMNTATSVSSTSSLEMKSLFTEQVTRPDYPDQTGGNDLSRNKSGYRRLTLREKVAKQRSEREREAKANVDTSTEENSPCARLTKTTSVGCASSSATNYHRPTARSQSNDAITEERTVFGFKIMRGLPSSSNAGNKTSTSFTRHTSLRPHIRITNNSTSTRFRDKAGNTFFYSPKNTRVSETTSKLEGNVEPEERDEVKNEYPICSDTNRQNSDIEAFSANKEVEVKNKESKIDKKLIIKAESLREGKSRLQEFREKQRRGKLTRSLTNPDFEQIENATISKGKNISESLAEIRERIRERRRKKDQLKKSQSMPETELPPEKSAKVSNDAKANVRKPTKVELRKEMNESKECETDKVSSLNELEYLEIEETSKANNSGYVTVMDTTCEDKVTIDSSGKELAIAETKNEEENVKDKNDNEVDTVDTRSSEVIVMDTGVEKDLSRMDKGDTKEKESDKKNSVSKKIELQEIVLSEKEESEKSTSQFKQKESRDAKMEVQTDLSKETSTMASTSEQTKSVVKKPTKRERRKLERYQRSKTMSAIMHNEISLDARREMQHKGRGALSEKNGESIAIPSVSEIKKRFLETESGSAKISEPGLFYSGKTFEKSSGMFKSTSRSTTTGKLSAKDDTSKGKSPEVRSRSHLPRRHSLAVGRSIESKAAQEDDVKTAVSKNDNCCLINEMKSAKTKAQTKTPLGRRHTLPSLTTEIFEKNTHENNSVSNEKKEVSGSEGRLPVRRHTFSSQTTWMISGHNPVKFSESVETIREKFSKGGAPVFNLATSSRQVSSTSVFQNNFDCNERQRRRLRSDSSLQSKFITDESQIAKGGIKKETSSGTLLSRRHTIANRPTLERQNSERYKQEGHELLDKFLAKDDKIQESKKLEKQKITKDVDTKTEQSVQTSRRSKKDKEEKLSVSKLRKLFLGQGTPNEKKTKLRDRRAKTIAGGISPEIMGELDISKSRHVISNKYVVKPDIYVSDTNTEEKTEEDIIERPERRRRSSDLNPNSYLSSKPLSLEETEKDCVFANEKPLKENVKPQKVLSDVKTTIESSLSDFNQARRRSGSESDLKKLGIASVQEDKSSRVESDVINLKTATEANVSVSNIARHSSDSESNMNMDSSIPIKDQNLDDYLTTIKTLAESPRISPQGSPQKGKFTSSECLDQKEARKETRRHLDVVKKNLSTHSWSTSDLDKLIHGGDGVHVSTSQVNISTVDLDEISSSTTRLQSLTEGRTKVRPKRTSSKSLNPLKSLMERTDVKTHTEEPVEEENKSTPAFEKPKKRSNPKKKRSQLEPWRRHTLDPVALAALASREDFARVSLRKTKGLGKENDEYDGSLPVMLIQVKGRRQVQTRLVEPSLSSLNTGDCFILVTAKELFCWIGEQANTVEKAKAVEISSKIQKRRDMNCKTGDVLYIDETKQGNTLAYRKFCKILQGDTTFPIEDARLCPDDEFYEREVISTNKVYKLQEGDPPHLIPVKDQCGYMPRIAILNTKEIFVFDFGSELYLWTGQQSLSAKRKIAFHLAEMLYKQQFDSESIVTPIDPRRPLKRSQAPKLVYHDADGNECGRPRWTLFARLHEKAETLLFQEKFFDWPDPTKIIKMKGHVSSGEIPERLPPVELKPCDAIEMQKPASDLEPAILEATNLGRGLGTPNIEVNGEVKEGDLVTTLGMTVWLVTQNKHFVLPKPSEGHFHSGDGYVIRWVYFVAKNRLVRDRRGRVRPLTGRQRCAYFFWQGNECSVNEKGAAAIMAVELDEEHGPQIRVVEGKEPPHFLNLFDGAMVIHSGKRVRVSDEQDEFSDKSTVRMYCIRNEDISEGCLVQVKRNASSLRSRSSFVVVDSETGNIFVWHGCKVNEYHKKSAEKAANFIRERRPLEMKLSEEISPTLIEIEEGQESDIFWTTVSGTRNSYSSLLTDPLDYDFCPRLFLMSSATGHFASTEILNPSRYPGRTCPFPVLQDDLYSASQPAAFLLDVGDEIYVWEGWMPAEITKDKRGSAKRRWDEERKLTLQTTLSYVKEANERIKKGAYVVQAGLEPLSFTNHFPFWNRRQSITEIKEMDGKKDCEKKLVEKVLDNFTQKYYSFQKLTGENPPDGVDPSKLETYLTDDEFQKIFEMSRDLFSQLPGWKQDVLKKAFGLF